MCGWCRKVRDDDSYWSGVEDYVVAHSELRFSHGVCPTCAVKLKEEIAARRRQPRVEGDALGVTLVDPRRGFSGER